MAAKTWTAMVFPFEDWTLLREVLSHYEPRILAGDNGAEMHKDKGVKRERESEKNPNKM